MAEESKCAPLTPESIVIARRKIDQHINRTPLVQSEALNQIASSQHPKSAFQNHDDGKSFTSSEQNDGDFLKPKFNLYFKCENEQRTGAFKARGAFHALSSLIEIYGLAQIRHRGVFTASSGNHAQGLALASVTHNVPVTIIMPKTSASTKIAGVAEIFNITNVTDEGGKSERGQIIFCGAMNQDKVDAIDALKNNTRSIFVPPYAHPDIILGQGTCAMELEEQFGQAQLPTSESHLDAVVAPIGGGGLLGGIATWFSNKPGVRVFGAEPSFEGADDARRGLEQGQRIVSVASSTIADGLRTPVGELNWKIVSDKKKVEDVYSVSEEEIAMAMKLLYQETGMLIEPSGCVPLAVVMFNNEFRTMAALNLQSSVKRFWNVAIVLSGGNTTIETMHRLTDTVLAVE